MEAHLTKPPVHTGNSLGGALSQLAAYNLVEAPSAAKIPVRPACYTFGAPRVGNHAFAQNFADTIPDTWHLINDQACILWGLISSLTCPLHPGKSVIL